MIVIQSFQPNNKQFDIFCTAYESCNYKQFKNGSNLCYNGGLSCNQAKLIIDVNIVHYIVQFK